MPQTIGVTQLSLPIFEDLQDKNLDTLMSFSAAFPVPKSLKLEKVSVSKARILVYGGNFADLLARLDPLLLSWRMLQQLLMMDEGELKLLRRLPDWGMTRNGALYRLPMPERRTSAIDGSVWATPTAHDFQNRKMPPEDKTHVTKSGTLKYINPTGLSYVNLGQTVKYYEQKQDWHTPIANDALKNGVIAQIPENGLSAQIRAVSAIPDAQLNPAWIEMLQGLPPGWTEIG